MGQFICGPEGVPGEGTSRTPAHGCPCFSLNEPHLSELMLPKGYKTIIDWFNEVADDLDYINPKFTVMTIDGAGNENENGPRKWEEVVGKGEEWVAHDISEKSESGVKIVEVEEAEERDVKEEDVKKENGVNGKEHEVNRKENEVNGRENSPTKSPDVPRTIQIAIRGALENALAGVSGVLTNGRSTGANGGDQTKETADEQPDDASKEDVL